MFISKELREKLPPIDHFLNTPAEEVPVIARFVAGMNNYYAWEYDPKNKRFFGLVKGREVRVGFFTVRALEGRYAQPDEGWKPQTLADLADKIGIGWIKERR